MDDEDDPQARLCLGQLRHQPGRSLWLSPLARMTILPVPAGTCLARTAPADEAFTPLPATVSSPGLGTVTCTVAVPFFLALTLPSPKALVGVVSALDVGPEGPVPLRE
jgi:hypothetical protein